jgi:hypothetical protein
MSGRIAGIASWGYSGQSARRPATRPVPVGDLSGSQSLPIANAASNAGSALSGLNGPVGLRRERMRIWTGRTLARIIGRHPSARKGLSR